MNVVIHVIHLYLLFDCLLVLKHLQLLLLLYDDIVNDDDADDYVGDNNVLNIDNNDNEVPDENNAV